MEKYRNEVWECRVCIKKLPCTVSIKYEYEEDDTEIRFKNPICLCGVEEFNWVKISE